MTRRASGTASGLDEVSAAIGGLRAGQTAQGQFLADLRTEQKDHGQKLHEIAETLSLIKSSLPDLPPSKTCILKHQEFDAKLTDMDKRVTWLSAKVSAVVAAIMAGLKMSAAKFGVDL